MYTGDGIHMVFVYGLYQMGVKMHHILSRTLNNAICAIRPSDSYETSNYCPTVNAHGDAFDHATLVANHCGIPCTLCVCVCMCVCVCARARVYVHACGHVLILLQGHGRGCGRSCHQMP